MDSRLDLFGALGLTEGDAHMIRNAGGVVTDDAIRSLVISQRLLKTEEIVLIHHTDCGMQTFTDDGFRRQIQDEIGIKPSWATEAFDDLDEDVRQSIARIKLNPFIRTRVRCGASSTTSKTASCTKSSEPPGAPSHLVRSLSSWCARSGRRAARRRPPASHGWR